MKSYDTCRNTGGLALESPACFKYLAQYLSKSFQNIRSTFLTSIPLSVALRPGAAILAPSIGGVLCTSSAPKRAADFPLGCTNTENQKHISFMNKKTTLPRHTLENNVKCDLSFIKLVHIDSFNTCQRVVYPAL